MSILDGDVLIEQTEDKISDLEKEALKQGMTLSEYIEHLKLLEMINRVSAKTIGADLVPAKPSPGSLGRVFYLDF